MLATKMLYSCCGVPLRFIFSALQLMVSALLFSVRANELRLENEVPTLSWKVFMNILQPKLKVIICCNLRLIEQTKSQVRAVK